MHKSDVNYMRTCVKEKINKKKRNKARRTFKSYEPYTLSS